MGSNAINTSILGMLEGMKTKSKDIEGVVKCILEKKPLSKEM